jgi:tetratricopeptide (TPR) repeat protein
MIIEQHYDEEVLAEFLGEAGDAVSRDKHLASCSLCQRTLASLRTTAQVLTRPSVWEKTPISTAPRPDTLAFLRNMQKTMADEDTLAAVWVKQLLAGPRDAWSARLAVHPEWRTAGMVRRLLKAGDEVINTIPADAVEIATLAAQIADRLDDSAKSGAASRHLRGLAHYDRAYALWYTGALPSALEELDTADDCLGAVPAAEFDRARIDVVRALINNILERPQEVLIAANAAARVFARYGDADRVAAARTSAAATLQAAQRLREALAIHVEIAEMEGLSERWKISAAHNMALCYRDLGDFDAAIQCLLRASCGYERLGMLTFRAKSRWVLAQVFAQQGLHERALMLFMDLRSEFQDLEMANDVAMLSLDMSESLLALNRCPEVADVCRSAIAYFSGAGLSETAPSLRGLAYIQEAAAAGRLTPVAISDVRAFILSPSPETHRLFLSQP